jgi:hypothetical protein
MSDLTVKEIVIAQPIVFRSRCGEIHDWATKLGIPMYLVRKNHGSNNSFNPGKRKFFFMLFFWSCANVSPEFEFQMGALAGDFEKF